MRSKNLIIALALTLLITVYSYAFEYKWTYDGTPLGQESYTPAEPIQLEIKGTAIDLNSGRAAIDLKQKYNVHLSDEFTDTQAAIMLKEFQKFFYINKVIALKKSLWHVIDSDIHLPNNILIYSPPDGDTVLISESVFDYNIAEIDGIRGESQSMDLFHAIVRYVTDNGEKWTAEHILFHRYGVDIQVYGDKFEELTKYTTGETHTSFERFKPEELVKLIFMLEQFPAGMRKTAGLNHIIRRRDGLSHPLYPEAAAVAWTTSGYIEFMESAFTTVDVSHIHRLILHEKAHFLWEHVFDDQLKEDWAELGGWYKEGDKWYTTHQTDFVSAYAHGHNPDEDMAETISYYIVNPDKLRTHAPEKYAFVQNRIMHGTRYISTIREDLTFEVYNLWPEYVYPGKVISTHIKVEGEPEEDKTVYIKFVTHSENESDHGKYILFRLFNRIGTYENIQLQAVDVNGNWTGNSSNIYTDTFTMSKHLPSGYWTLHSLTTIDSNGIWRNESIKDIGFQLYLDNPLEDIAPPQYIEGSLKMSLTRDDDAQQILNFTWLAEEDHRVKFTRILLNNETNNNVYTVYQDTYISDNIRNNDGYQIIYSDNMLIPEYLPDGIYTVSEINMRDVGNNGSAHRFLEDVKERPSIEITTSNPDTTPPELDLNRISVNATPYDTNNLNGKTIVELIYHIKDDISHHKLGYVRLRDPSGTTHGYYMMAYDNILDSSLLFTGDPSIWREYKKVIILPEGSIPGIWGVSSIHIEDRAGNKQEYDFTKIVRFDVIDSSGASPASIVTQSNLLPNYPNPSNPETWIPFQLSKSGNVTIRIYSVEGGVVRTLDLGHQSTGRYIDKSRAAYWDGRNEYGESVASGLYFLTFTTNDYSATRKILIRR